MARSKSSGGPDREKVVGLIVLFALLAVLLIRLRGAQFDEKIFVLIERLLMITVAFMCGRATGYDPRAR